MEYTFKHGKTGCQSVYLHVWLVCCLIVPGPAQLPPPPSAIQDSSAFAAGDRNTVVTTSASSVHDAGPALPRRPDAASGAHSRSSSLDNQLIDFTDAGHGDLFNSSDLNRVVHQRRHQSV